MSAETTVRDALLALLAVSAIVADRIRPVVLKEDDDYPAIAYKRENTEYTNTIGNAAVASKVTIDVICLDENFDGAEALCDAAETVGLEKLNRRSEYDPDTKAFAAVLTVAVWP